MIRVLQGDCRAVLAGMAADTFHAVVTDPPYHLSEVPHVVRGGFGGERSDERRAARAGFMGRAWDGGDLAFRPDTWRAVFRVLRPGAHMLCFGGTRTFHRMACAIEDAGFEIRDTVMWLYGSGFPKSLDVSKAIDRHLGATREAGRPRVRRGDKSAYGDKSHAGYVVATAGMSGDDAVTAPATPEAAQWAGWGTALKPAYEPIILARKPLDGTMAQNVLAHGCGGLHIDKCRIPISDEDKAAINAKHAGMDAAAYHRPEGVSLNLSVNPMPLIPAQAHALGRYPANIVHDGSPEVLAAFAAFGESRGEKPRLLNRSSERQMDGWGLASKATGIIYGDTGTAARFFFSSKADTADRADSKHPTVKPVDLMRWLVRLVTPPGGHVLDCFAGSGTTGEACMLVGFDCTLIEQDAAIVADIRHRMTRWGGGDLPLFSAWPPADTDPQDERLADLFKEAAE